MLVDTTMVLLHSPLVGPTTWQPVAALLRDRGCTVVLPRLLDSKTDERPFWQQHVDSALASLPQSERLVLVAHSGAGPLLPAICQSVKQRVTACLFVDAGVPLHQHSRLDLMRLQDAEWTKRFEAMLHDSGRFPTWTDAALQNHIFDDTLRQRFMSEIVPRALPFFEEPIPVYDKWPDVPCAYLKLSAAYAWDLKQAIRYGWTALNKEAGHFYMLEHPEDIIDWMQQLLSTIV